MATVTVRTRSLGETHRGHASPGGLALAADGLRFDPSETWFEPGVTADWTFRIVGDDGRVVTDFEDAHG